MRWKNTAIATATLVFAGCAACAGIARADPPAPPPEPMTTMDHAGTYSVGTDILPGTYSSAGPAGNGACYWKRLGGPNGSDIIDNALSTKPQVVRLDPTDTAFRTDRCQPWQKTDSASADGTTPGVLPALTAAAQLHTYIDTLNSSARQFDGEQLPQP
jgi:poly(3-hydroxybutyrate) depolymerase